MALHIFSPETPAYLNPCTHVYRVQLYNQLKLNTVKALGGMFILTQMSGHLFYSDKGLQRLLGSLYGHLNSCCFFLSCWFGHEGFLTSRLIQSTILTNTFNITDAWCKCSYSNYTDIGFELVIYAYRIKIYVNLLCF